MKSVPERLPAATQCLEQAFPDEATGTLTRVVLARYEGRPAYFGLYAVGPGAGLPPTQLLLLVASVHGCDLLAAALHPSVAPGNRRALRGVGGFHAWSRCAT